MNIVFWGSSDFSLPSLENLLSKHNIIALVTNPDKPIGRGGKEIHKTPVKIVGEKNNIKIFQPSNLKNQEGDLLYNELNILNPDLFVVVSYGKILPEKFLNIPKYGSINLHASLLPKYRGPSPIQEALLRGDTKTGNTIQFMSKEMDKGDIILQSEINIDPNDNYLTLSEKMAKDGANLLLHAIDLIISNKVERKKQNDEEASYCKIINREDGLVSFKNEKAVSIFNKLRAYYPWPGIFSYYSNKAYCENNTENNTLIHFLSIEVIISEVIKPGIIINADKKGLIIGTKENLVKIITLKPSGKKEMDYISFINGYKPIVGNYF